MDRKDSLRVLSVKSVGEPYAGNPHVRFDEGRGGNPRLLYRLIKSPGLTII